MVLQILNRMERLRASGSDDLVPSLECREGQFTTYTGPAILQTLDMDAKIYEWSCTYEQPVMTQTNGSEDISLESNKNLRKVNSTTYPSQVLLTLYVL